MSPGSTPARELHLNSNVLNSGKHDHGWRLQDDPLSYLDIRYYQHCAQVAERGTLDAIFLADGVAIGPEAGARPWNSLEPTVVLAAVAAVTERVGLVATASTTFNEPYNLARRFASLDQISGGRVAVNIVTSLDARSAANFSLDSHPDAAERYARAEEFVDVLIKLWDSWEDGALVADQKSGVFADISRVHAIDHRGEHFSVAGPLNVPRAPQGRPVIVQAGSSEAGRQLAARTADALFTVQNTFEEAQQFYREIKDRARRFGRDPEQVLILPGLLPSSAARRPRPRPGWRNSTRSSISAARCSASRPVSASRRACSSSTSRSPPRCLMTWTRAARRASSTACGTWPGAQASPSGS
jgi:FMN-dependent oxidoreductase (nitrilotriacetate monooxygenase family)